VISGPPQGRVPRLREDEEPRARSQKPEGETVSKIKIKIKQKRKRKENEKKQNEKKRNEKKRNETNRCLSGCVFGVWESPVPPVNETRVGSGGVVDETTWPWNPGFTGCVRTEGEGEIGLAVEKAAAGPLVTKTRPWTHQKLRA
jgi:hypothetical protein